MSDDYLVVPNSTSVNGDRRLHTDEDCRAIVDSKRVRSADDQETDDLEECAHCKGDSYVPQGQGDWSYQRALKRANPDDTAGVRGT